jgi:hypothetical protein
MNSPEKLRRCSRCGESKPDRGFARDRSKASGLKSHCKDCDNLRKKLDYERKQADVPAYLRRTSGGRWRRFSS